MLILSKLHGESRRSIILLFWRSGGWGGGGGGVGRLKVE